MNKKLFQKPLTFWRAIFLPFRITPVATTVIILYDIICLLIAPTVVLVEASFIDAVIRSFADSQISKNAILSLILLAFLKMFGTFTEPFIGLIKKKREEANWKTLNHELLDTYAGLELKHIENSDTMDLIIRIWSESPETMLTDILEDVRGFFVQTSTYISYLLILFAHAPISSLIILLASIPIIWIARKCGKDKYTLERDLSENERITSKFSEYMLERRYTAERNMFGYTPFINEKYSKIVADTDNQRIKINEKNSIRKNISAVILMLFCAFTLVLLLPEVESGKITVGLFISLIGVLFSTVNGIALGLSSYFEFFTVDREYIKDFNDYMALSKEEGVLEKMADKVPNFEKLEFKNVSFTYPGTEKPVLRDVSFVIEAGKRYSLLGINGSGKTTITKLILRMYNDYEGDILLNGKPLREWDMTVVKGMFAAVFQDFIQYDISLADNVAVGRGLDAEENEILSALDAVGLSSLSKTLPNGLHTMLGKIYDESVDLSGGQWQRIALARAVISNAQLKILDEPTASLDPIAEKEVYENFDTISKSAATIFISHRLASAKLSDVIYVLDDGKITESGNHTELMEKGGLYAEMFKSQQEWFKN